MLVAVLLLYLKFHGDLENVGLEFNPYNPWVANRINVGKQYTVILHVDNVMYSHVSPKFNNKFKEWMYRNNGKHGEVKANREKAHEFLGMNFDFT